MAKKRKDRRRPPYWVVCGMPRGGTSMVMEALIAGGMEAHYVPHGDLIERDRKHGFKSNPNDVYEWDTLPNPLPRSLRGKLFKMFPWHIQRQEPGPFRVVLITRNYEDLKASVDAFVAFGEKQWGAANKQVKRAQEILEMEGMGNLFIGLASVVSNLPTVKDVLMVDYDAVCNEPEGVFGFLAEEGWPIDVEKAAAVPNRRWRDG